MIGHNLDVIKTADHIIDLGPEAGVVVEPLRPERRRRRDESANFLQDNI